MPRRQIERTEKTCKIPGSRLSPLPCSRLAQNVSKFTEEIRSRCGTKREKHCNSKNDAKVDLPILKAGMLVSSPASVGGIVVRIMTVGTFTLSPTRGSLTVAIVLISISVAVVVIGRRLLAWSSMFCGITALMGMSGRRCRNTRSRYGRGWSCCRHRRHVCWCGCSRGVEDLGGSGGGVALLVGWAGVTSDA